MSVPQIKHTSYLKADFHMSLLSLFLTADTEKRNQRYVWIQNCYKEFLKEYFVNILL